MESTALRGRVELHLRDSDSLPRDVVQAWNKMREGDGPDLASWRPMTDRQKRRLFLIVLAIGGALTLLGTWYLAPGLLADFS